MPDDLISSFVEQFEPYEAGYLYYPSRRSGGKFVTSAEFEMLKWNWERVAGRRGVWLTVGVVLAICLGLAALIEWAAPPSWVSQVVPLVIAFGLAVRIAWASFAPVRLGRGRAEVTPPRPKARR